MKDNYIELIEKTAMHDLLKARKVNAGNDRTEDENKLIADNNLETYIEGSPVETSLLLNVNKVMDNSPDGFKIYSRGKGKRDSIITGTTQINDIPREVAIKNNREAEYENNLNTIRNAIKTRTAIGTGVQSALTVGGTLLGAAATGARGSGVLPGALSGIIAGGTAGAVVKSKINKMNANQYLNSLEDYQKDELDKVISSYADRVAHNPYTHDSVLSIGPK